jgi:hypothetical protein
MGCSRQPSAAAPLLRARQALWEAGLAELSAG